MKLNITPKDGDFFTRKFIMNLGSWNFSLLRVIFNDMNPNMSGVYGSYSAGESVDSHYFLVYSGGELLWTYNSPPSGTCLDQFVEVDPKMKKNMRFKVSSATESEAVQKWLHERGYGKPGKMSYTNLKFIFAHASLSGGIDITFSSYQDTYDEKVGYIEMDVEFETRVKSVNPKQKMINVNGVSVPEPDLIKFLEKYNPENDL